MRPTIPLIQLTIIMVLIHCHESMRLSQWMQALFNHEDDISEEIQNRIPSASSSRYVATIDSDKDLPVTIQAESLVPAALISAVSRVLVTFIYCHAAKQFVGHIISQAQKMANSTSQVPSLRMKKYLPPDCQLNPYEIELLESVSDPTEVDGKFSKIGGFDTIKSSIQEFVFDVLSYDLLSSSTMKPAQAMLLYGPPGCGKTSMIQASCTHFDLPMISVVPSMLLRKYVGETNQLLKSVFSLCVKMQPCILFIDEVDSLMRLRGDDDSFTERNVKMEFMQLWDNLARSNAKIVIFGATNRPQDLDPAVHRRFERSLMIPPPNYEDRIEIFRAVLNTSKNAVEKDFNYDLCASLTDSYSASDIVAVCKTAVAAVHREVLLKNKVSGSLKSGNMTEFVISLRNQTSSNSSSTTTSKIIRQRPLRLSDIENALKSVYPTAWYSKSYGSISKE